jgi:murein L,D-transpeptidase YcbB/YkuD
MMTGRLSGFVSLAGAVAMLAVGLIATAVVGTSRAEAQGQRQWNPFRQDYASYSSASYDREFVRRWEANPPRGYPTLSRDNIDATKKAVAFYKKIVADGGWPKVPAKKMRVGARGKAVLALRERLTVAGHIKSGSSFPSYFGYDVETALKRFQATNGLSPTGVTDRRTIAALNIPAKVRLRQLRINLDRLRSLAKPDKARYVVVNIPSAQIEAVEDNRVVSRHTGVVGKIDRPTPRLSSRIHEINFNPSWHLPPTVVREDLIPKGRKLQRKKRDVLEEFGIDAYSGGRKLDTSKVNWNSGQPYTLTYKQKPGKDNPLGFAKINFHNAHSVYLHDTPSDRMFGRNFRAASSGCVRVQNIETLISWLLRDSGDWSVRRVEAIRKNGETETVRLKRAVPLHMVYITAWATEDGNIQFRRDIYNRDGVGRIAASY